MPVPVGPVGSAEQQPQPFPLNLVDEGADERPRRSSCPASTEQVSAKVEFETELQRTSVPPPGTTVETSAPDIPFNEGAVRLAVLAEKIVSNPSSDVWRSMYTEFLEEYSKVAQCIESGLETCKEEKGPFEVDPDKSALVAFQLMLNWAKLSKRRIEEQAKAVSYPFPAGHVGGVPAPQLSAPCLGAAPGVTPGMTPGFMMPAPLPMARTVVPVWYQCSYMPQVMASPIPAPLAMMPCNPCQFSPHAASPAHHQEWTPGSGGKCRNKRVSGFGSNRRGSLPSTPSAREESRVTAASPLKWNLPVGDSAPLPTPKRANRYDIVNPVSGECVLPELARIRTGKSPLVIRDPKTGESVLHFDPDRPCLARTLPEIPEDKPDSAVPVDMFSTPRKDMPALSPRSEAPPDQGERQEPQESGESWILENSHGGKYGSWDHPLSRPEKKERALMIRQIELLMEIQELKLQGSKR